MDRGHRCPLPASEVRGQKRILAYSEGYMTLFVSFRSAVFNTAYAA